MGVRGTAPICFSIVLVILSLAGCAWQSDAPGFTYPEPVDPASIFSVSTYGSDSNPGTMQAPWKTIQKAASTLVTGQKVYVMEGIFHERVSVKNSGAPGSPIVFSAYPGARVVYRWKGYRAAGLLHGAFQRHGSDKGGRWGVSPWTALQPTVSARSSRMPPAP